MEDNGYPKEVFGTEIRCEIESHVGDEWTNIELTYRTWGWQVTIEGKEGKYTAGASELGEAYQSAYFKWHNRERLNLEEA